MPLSRIYPLRTLSNQRSLWGWISYDVANQSFTLLINTLLFSIFFTSVIVTDPTRSSTLWSYIYAASMLITVIVSPIAGAIADARAWKKEALLISGVICASCTCALALLKPGQFWLAALLYIPANFAFSIGENFLASFLPELADRKDFGRVSGFSWALAYFAALMILLLTAASMKLLALERPDAWRPFFVFAGLWFFLFMIPTALLLAEKAHAAPSPAIRSRSALTEGFARLAQSLHNTRHHRDLAMLLVASLFYGAGMSVVIFFASLIAAEYGFNDVALVLFVGVITISGVFGTLIPTALQDRLGHKRTTILLLALWIMTALLLALYTYQCSRLPKAQSPPTWPLWILGNFLGLGLGSLGSANRAFVGYLAPATRTAEIFGLWGMVFKLAAVLTVPFAIVRDHLGTPASLLVLCAFIVIGMVLTCFVNETRGLEAARSVDRNADLNATGSIPGDDGASLPSATSRV